MGMVDLGGNVGEVLIYLLLIWSVAFFVFV